MAATPATLCIHFESMKIHFVRLKALVAFVADMFFEESDTDIFFQQAFCHTHTLYDEEASTETLHTESHSDTEENVEKNTHTHAFEASLYTPSSVCMRLRLVTYNLFAHDGHYGGAIRSMLDTCQRAMEIGNECRIFTHTHTSPEDLLIINARLQHVAQLLSVMTAPFGLLAPRPQVVLPAAANVIRLCEAGDYPFKLPHPMPALTCDFLRVESSMRSLAAALPPTIQHHFVPVNNSEALASSHSVVLSATALPREWIRRQQHETLIGGCRKTSFSPTAIGLINTLMERTKPVHPTTLKQISAGLCIYNKSHKRSGFVRKRTVGHVGGRGLPLLVLFLLMDVNRDKKSLRAVALSLFVRLLHTPRTDCFDIEDDMITCFIGQKRRKVVEMTPPKQSRQSVISLR